MPIKFKKADSTFTLTTKNTLYQFKVVNGCYLVHTYYGKKLPTPKIEFDPYVVSFSPYRKEWGNLYSPDIMFSECPTFGAGDFRATALRIKNKDGNSVTEFDYVNYKKYSGRYDIPSLPHARATEDTETLEITMKDRVTNCILKLYYTVFYRTDIITRSMQIINGSGDDITIKNCMPLCLDLHDCNYDLIKLWGGHCFERVFERTPLSHGKQSIFSRRGASSHQFNPFMAVCGKKTTDEKGEVYGFNFVWSGSFENIVEVDQMDNTRILVGLGSDCFEYTLKNGESFSSPEAVMTFSKDGLNGMAGNFHKFINKCIVPENALAGHRPVVLNTWEACYFNIDEEKLVRFAEEAKKTGFDMLVMDDGWFGKRNHDHAGLGDWTPNPEKFKNGLASFVNRVKAHGIGFGIWIEPEMVNPDSDLFRAHPEWCIQCKGRDMSLSRDQLVLDMSNPDVIKYLKDSFTSTFNGVEIDYIKWDMNRHLSEAGSLYLAPEKQEETMYRYVLGVYELCRFFRRTYPNVMIEHCSGGGGRYDLGIMQYCSQIWTSDNTSAHSRIGIQYSSMLGYPASMMSCHVSNSGDDYRMLDYKFKVAVGGVLGYELNILTATDEAKAIMSKQVELYKTFDRLILTGNYHCILSPAKSRFFSHYFIDDQCKNILLSFVECRNAPMGKKFTLKIKQAIKDAVYKDTVSGKTYTGEELRRGIEIISTGEKATAELWHFIAE